MVMEEFIPLSIFLLAVEKGIREDEGGGFEVHVGESWLSPLKAKYLIVYMLTSLNDGATVVVRFSTSSENIAGAVHRTCVKVA